jgi:hypothetical protein
MSDPEHQIFLDHITGKVPDELPPTKKTIATPREIGWWKQHQVRRAIRHARDGRATQEELNLLRSKGIFYPAHPIPKDR